MHEATSHTSGSNTSAHKNKDQQAAIKDLFGSGATSHDYCATHKTDRGETIRSKGKAWNIAWCARIVAANNPPSDWDEQTRLRVNMMFAPAAVLTTRSAVEDNVKMKLDIPEVKFVRTIYQFCQMIWRAIACRALPNITTDAGAQKMGKLFAIREKLFHIPKNNLRMWDITGRVMSGLCIFRVVIDAGFRVSSPARISGRTFDLVSFMRNVAQRLFVCSEDVSHAFALRFSAYFPEGLPVFAYTAGVASRLFSVESDSSGADRAAGEIMHNILQRYQPLPAPVVDRAIVVAKKRKRIDDDIEIVGEATGIQLVAQNIYSAKSVAESPDPAQLLSGDLSDDEIERYVRTYETEALDRIREIAALKDARSGAVARINPTYLTVGGKTDYRYVVIPGSVQTVAKHIFDANADIHANSGVLDLLPIVAIEHFITDPRDFKSPAYDITGRIARSPVERIRAVRVIEGETPCVAFSIEFIDTIGRYTQVRFPCAYEMRAILTTACFGGGMGGVRRRGWWRTASRITPRRTRIR